MKAQVFTEKEKQLIKEKMTQQAKSMDYEFDIDHAYDRFEFVLSQMRKDIRVRYINNIEYTCSRKTPQKTPYDHYAYFAVKMEEHLSYNFIVDVTKHGNIIFLPRFPDEGNKYIFKSQSDKIWSRAELEEKLSQYQSDSADAADDENDI